MSHKPHQKAGQIPTAPLRKRRKKQKRRLYRKDPTQEVFYAAGEYKTDKDAEELSISETEFRDKMNGYHNRCEEIEWTPIGMYRDGGL